MKNLSGEVPYSHAQSIHYTLRIASAMCFIGHGVFGIITKPIWCNYFAVFGIGHDVAYKLMPFVGALDILMGLSLLIYPIRAVAGWLVVWGIVTASLRPLSGEPAAELIERAGNYGAPLALLLLADTGRRRGESRTDSGIRKGWLFSRLDPNAQTDAHHYRLVLLTLRIAVFMLLVGHGWLNLIEKKGLLAQYQSLGFSDPGQVAHIAGIFELVAALAVLVRPVRPLLIAFFIWKMGTELFYPKWEIFEWVERSGSYGCILALWMALGRLPMRNPASAKTNLAV
jgi:uncharacterized membrane protein YphA (DoxX/SURF4 family)